MADVGEADEEVAQMEELWRELLNKRPDLSEDPDFSTTLSTNLEFLRHLGNMSLVDSVTRLENKRAFEGALQRAVKLGVRHGYPVSLCFIDVDDLKGLNSRYGHPATNDILRQLAETMKGDLRLEDRLFRYGGDEFVCTLPGAGLRGAYDVAERTRRVVEGRYFRGSGDEKVRLHISQGISSGYDPDTMVEEANQACRAAKENGKNTVFVYHDGKVISGNEYKRLMGSE